MTKPPASMVARAFLQDGLRELVLLPVWWYSAGLKRVFLWALGSAQSASHFFGLGVWVKNLFVPMYGETSITGRGISFGVRLVMILARGAAVITWILIAWIVFLFYVAVLPVLFISSVVNLWKLLF